MTLVLVVSIANAFLFASGGGLQHSSRTAVLVNSEGDDRSPSWSPDSKRFAFESNRHGNWDIFAASADGTNQQRLTTSDAAERNPVWSPIQNQLAFVRSEGGESAMCSLTLGDPTVHTVHCLLRSRDSEFLFPSWSRDGETLIYTRRRQDVFRLEALSVRDGTVRDLLGGFASQRDVWPRFSSEGGLAFFSRRLPHMEDDEVYFKSGTGLTRVTNRIGHDFCPAWSPEGTHLAIAVVGESVGPALVIIDLQDRSRRLVASGFAAITEPAWSPDGRTIAFAARAGQRYAIYRTAELEQ